jgi:serine/threonine protein kinase
LAPGLTIDGKYTIESFLGKGGMCSVYKATHLILKRPIALKMLHEKLLVDDKSVQRFQREALSASRLDHPSIVKVYGFGLIDSVPYIAMEFLDGASLSQLLEINGGRLPPPVALPIFCDILDGLAHAHERGVIHRDIKPSNIMLLGETSKAKIVDFGIAKVLPESGKEIQKLTNTGAIFGTLDYMSPEQCQGIALDARSDLYSFGCLMFEVLDGHPPFFGEEAYALLIKHVNEKPRESEYVSGDLGSAVQWCLEKDPAARPAQASVLKDALLHPSQRLHGRLQNETSQGPTKIWKILTYAGVTILLLWLSTFIYSKLTNQATSSSSERINTTHTHKRFTPARIEKAINDSFALQNQGKTDEAINLLEKLLEESNQKIEDAKVYLTLSQFLLYKNDKDQGGRSKGILLNKATLRTEQAISILDGERKLETGARLAHLQVKNNDNAAAKKTCNRFLAYAKKYSLGLSPSAATLHALYGVLMKGENKKRAIRELQTCLEISDQLQDGRTAPSSANAAAELFYLTRDNPKSLAEVRKTEAALLNLNERLFERNASFRFMINCARSRGDLKSLKALENKFHALWGDNPE